MYYNIIIAVVEVRGSKLSTSTVGGAVGGVLATVIVLVLITIIIVIAKYKNYRSEIKPDSLGKLSLADACLVSLLTNLTQTCYNHSYCTVLFPFIISKIIIKTLR